MIMIIIYLEYFDTTHFLYTEMKLDIILSGQTI